MTSVISITIVWVHYESGTVSIPVGEETFSAGEEPFSSATAK